MGAGGEASCIEDSSLDPRLRGDDTASEDDSGCRDDKLARKGQRRLIMSSPYEVRVKTTPGVDPETWIPDTWRSARFWDDSCRLEDDSAPEDDK